MKLLKCAVTGANGYLGKKITQFFREQNWIVYELVRSKDKAKQREYFSLFDLSEKNIFTLIDIDVLIHCAYDFTNTKVNIEGTQRLLADAAIAGVKKIIIISSLSAFENAISIYGKTKLAIEKISSQYNAIIIRPGLIFGEKTQGIVGAMQRFVQNFPIIPLIGLGNQQFYPCYISDLCNLIFTIIQTDQQYKKPIIAGVTESVKLKQIVSMLAMHASKKIIMIPIPFQIIYFILKLLELMRIPMGLRSDSVLGAVYTDPSPDFTELQKIKNITFRKMDCALL